MTLEYEKFDNFSAKQFENQNIHTKHVYFYLDQSANAKKKIIKNNRFVGI